MLIGYARTSTIEQEAGLADQKRELEKAGAERIFAEHVSAVAKSRPQFDVVMAMLRKGDILIVTKLDRLARSMADLMQIIKRIKEAGTSLRVLGALGLDTSTATGKLMLDVLGAVAEFERDLMLERQRVGIAKAKAEGKYKGRSVRSRMTAWPRCRPKASASQRLPARSASAERRSTSAVGRSRRLDADGSRPT